VEHKYPVDLPKIDLVHCLIIDITTDPSPEVFLLVQDVVLHARNDARTLRAFNSLRDSNASEVWVRAECLEVPATSGIAAQWPNDRSELDI
jgi:hypothetical protein